MFLPEVSIRRPVLAIMIIMSLVVLGAFSYSKIGVDLYPDIDFPYISVTTILPGASPETIEQKVTKPIEDVLSTISGLKDIMAFSYENSSFVMCEFQLEINADIAAQDVRDKISQVINSLPSDTETPIVAKLDFKAEPIIFLVLRGPDSISTLTKFAKDTLKPNLQKIPGVGDVNLVGGRERQVRIWVDADKLFKYNLEPADVVNALSAQNIELPGGRIETPEIEYIVKAKGEMPDVDSFAEIVIAYRDGSPVKLREVARVEDGMEDFRSMSRLNMVNALGIQIVKQSGANTVAVADKIHAQLARLNNTSLRLMPEGYNLEISQDKTKFIRDSFNDVQHHIVIGGLLALLVVLLFLRNLRATFIASLALPSSIIAAYTFIYAFGFTFNVMTLMALSVSIGMLVDDAIVVIENINRHMEQGKSPMQAAKDATNEIAFAVIVTTFSIVAVFVPVAFMEGIVGRMFYQFGITVSVAVLASLLVSLVLTPMLSSRMMGRKERTVKGRLIENSIIVSVAVFAVYIPVLFNSVELGKLLHEIQILLVTLIIATVAFSLLDMAITKFMRKSNEGSSFAAIGERFFLSIEHGYSRIVRLALKNTLTKSSVVAIGFIFFIAAGFLITKVPFEFFPDIDRGQFMIALKAPLGSTVEKTYSYMQKIEKYALEQIPEVELVQLTIGGGSSGAVNEGQIDIKLTPRTSRVRKQSEIINQAREFMKKEFPDLISAVGPSEAMGGGGTGLRGGDVEFNLRGESLEELSSYANMLKEKLDKVPGFSEVRLSYDPMKPEARVLIDRERAAANNVSVFAVGRAIQIAIGGVEATQYREQADQYEVWVRLEQNQREKMTDIYNVPIRAGNGSMIRLHDLVRVEESTGPVEINRQSRQRQITIYVNLDKDIIKMGDAKKVISSETAKLDLPPTVSMVFTGVSDIQDESNKNILKSLILAIIIVYMLLAAQFNSFMHPLTIMISLPMSFIGAFALLYLTGQSMNLMSEIGIIMLMGIVTKNAILLVDFTNQMRERGMEKHEALAEAGAVRLRPILMTTVATMFGMLPVALGLGEGGEMRQPMAVAVIGGLITSTILTLIVVPVVYSLFDSFAQNRLFKAILGSVVSNEE